MDKPTGPLTNIEADPSRAIAERVAPSFGYKLAVVSASSMPIVVTVFFTSRALGLRVPLVLFSAILILVGLYCGVVSLFFIRSEPKIRILIPATLGILLNGYVVWRAVALFRAVS